MTTPEGRAAYVNSQVACALIELEAMKVENQLRAQHGLAQAYGEAQICALIGRYGLDPNSVITTLG